MSEKLTAMSGLRVTMDPGMMRDAWFIKDGGGCILSCGVAGYLSIGEPPSGAAAEIQCGSHIYDMLRGRAMLAAAGGKTG